MYKPYDFTKYLKEWIVYSQQYLYTMKDRPDLMCYGVGSNTGGNSWGMQTNQKALAAFIIASYSPEIDWSGTELTSQKVREQGLAMLRFTLASHKTGDYHCTHGNHWGGNWICALGTTRMLHAINAVWDDLTDKDKFDLRRVLISECDWLISEYPIKAGLTSDNHPESNIWNGSILYQTACLYPDAPNREKYLDKATRFFINGISTENDKYSDVVYDGIKVKDAFVGANMFDTMACNHHGYMNVGYMVICLSNLAMLYFWCKERGHKLPEAFDHHVIDAWKLIRSCTFEDGRLWRIGGDSRIRYCYCQDYALPMWALMSERYDEDCSDLIRGWLNQVDTEVINNADGSFLSDRLSFMLETTPYYYTRVESDRACTLSMLGYWTRMFDIDGRSKTKIFDVWHDNYHGSVMVRGENRKASFTWRASAAPTGICVPSDCSNLAEWKHNLTGCVNSFGAINNDRVITHTELLFDGGFLTFGQTASESRRFFCEGYRLDTTEIKTLAFAALDDDQTVICIQYSVSPNRFFAKSFDSLLLRLPNDVYNKNLRKFYFDNSELDIKGGKHAIKQNVKVGKWINIDNKIGVSAIDELTIKCPKFRQIDISVQNDTDIDSNREGYGSLYTNDIVASYSDKPLWLNPDDEIYRTAFAVNIGTSEDTKKMHETLTLQKMKSDDLIAVSVQAANGKDYLLVLNIGKNTINVELPEGFELFSGKLKLNETEALLACRCK